MTKMRFSLIYVSDLMCLVVAVLKELKRDCVLDRLNSSWRWRQAAPLTTCTVKLELYRRSGVGEYLVNPGVMSVKYVLYRLADGVYELIRPDEDGVLRSQVLPGFWFRADWCWEGRVAELIELVEEGIASPEHREFVARLTAGE